MIVTHRTSFCPLGKRNCEYFSKINITQDLLGLFVATGDNSCISNYP